MTSVLSTEPFPQHTLTLLSIKQHQLALLQTAEEFRLIFFQGRQTNLKPCTHGDSFSLIRESRTVRNGSMGVLKNF